VTPNRRALLTYQLDPVPKTPSEVVNELAQVLQKEIPRLAFNYFSIHYITWNLLTKLKGAFAKAVGPEFLQYVHQLPFVVGYVFPKAAGQGSTDVQERRLRNDSLFDIAAIIVREFLADGKGGLIKEASEWLVEPEDVEGIDMLRGCERTRVVPGISMLLLTLGGGMCLMI
jgi:hypothetical protein